MRRYSIILADDERHILFGMKNGIAWEELGFEVVGTAQNGKEALELIEEHHPDLLIGIIKSDSRKLYEYKSYFVFRVGRF